MNVLKAKQFLDDCGFDYTNEIVLQKLQNLEAYINNDYDCDVCQSQTHKFVSMFNCHECIFGIEYKYTTTQSTTVHFSHQCFLNSLLKEYEREAIAEKYMNGKFYRVEFVSQAYKNLKTILGKGNE